ncbi:MAG: hypothetical protein KDI71_14580 [Xanthomonadales bacterium]|nr:hypothetical protein [Xanthomonadales bacterium]
MQQDVELHPLCTFFPRLGRLELASLAEDIKTHGLREPITTINGMILDGGNRSRACEMAGVEPRYVEYDGTDPVAFVLSKNLERRHLTPGQRAAIVAAAQDWSKAHPQGKPETCNVAPLATVADRAELSGASHRTQLMADKVARENPELAAQVAHGDISLPAAAKQLAPKVEPESKPATDGHFDDPPQAPPPPEGDPPPPPYPAPEAPDAPPPPPTELELAAAEITDLKDRLSELAEMAEETRADNESMSVAFEANEPLVAALAEAKKYREQNRILQTRITGLMNEKGELVRIIRGLRRSVTKLENVSKNPANGTA